MNFIGFAGKIIDMIAAGASARVKDDAGDVRPVQGVRTLYDEVKERWPTASDTEVDEILWLTPYPAGDRDSVVNALTKMFKRWGDKPLVVIDGEMAQLESMYVMTKGRR